MLASFLLALREGLEGALVIGIVLAALKKLDRSRLSQSVWQGVVAAAAVSLAAGFLLSWLGAKLEGQAEELFEGITMFVAAVLLTWMIIWMQRQSGGLKKDLEAGVLKATSGDSSQWGLFWLAFLAVGREGIELVLFLAAVQTATDSFQTYSGALLGLAVSASLGWVLFASSKRMSLRLFFNITNVLLVLFAAGLLAHGVHAFNEAAIIPPVIEQVWDLNPILDETQFAGQLLTALLGYNGNPSLTEITAYALYILGAFVLWMKLAPVQKLSSKQLPNT